MFMKRVHHYPAALSRDHARPRTAPAPRVEAVEAALTALIQPATYALTAEYQRRGCRWRVLSLPVMVAFVLSLIWRQVPSVSTLVRMLAREPLLWVPPLRVSQQALSQRLRELPADLFAALLPAILPTLQTRAAARQRPLAPPIRYALTHYARVWAVDASTLEALFRKVGLLRGAPRVPLGGKIVTLLDLATKLPVHLWWNPDPTVNEKTFLDRVQAVLPPDTLLLLDRGFYAFAFFEWLTAHAIPFITRQRGGHTVVTVDHVLQETPTLRDHRVHLGQRKNPCQVPLRLVEVLVAGTWHGYLTNELDPQRLPPETVIALYAQRWRIEEAFLLVKRLLGLAYLWTGALNGLALQLWATWLLYAVLVDLSDAVAEELNVPLDRISVEMVFRGLYFFAGAYQRGEATDPVRYLAQQSDLGIVKRLRKSRAVPTLDTGPPTLTCDQ
jgi:hypothetical protein